MRRSKITQDPLLTKQIETEKEKEKVFRKKVLMRKKTFRTHKSYSKAKYS